MVRAWVSGEYISNAPPDSDNSQFLLEPCTPAFCRRFILFFGLFCFLVRFVGNAQTQRFFSLAVHERIVIDFIVYVESNIQCTVKKKGIKLQ